LETKRSRFDKISNDIAYYSRAIRFDELKSLLLNNNIKMISVIFYLLSKDKLQNVINHGKICSFVIDLSNDESLEVAYQKGVRGPYPLEKDEIKFRHGWEEYHTYLYGKYGGLEDDM